MPIQHVMRRTVRQVISWSYVQEVGWRVMAMGRPRGFDPDAVVDAAVEVFWRKGYEGASMADLCAATGLRPGSIYAAWGSKLGLFSAAVDRYVDTVFAYGMTALEAP